MAEQGKEDQAAPPTESAKALAASRQAIQKQIDTDSEVRAYILKLIEEHIASQSKPGGGR